MIKYIKTLLGLSSTFNKEEHREYIKKIKQRFEDIDSGKIDTRRRREYYMEEKYYDICSKEFIDKELELQKTMEVIHNKYFQSRLCDYGKYYSSDVVILIEQQLQAYKDTVDKLRVKFDLYLGEQKNYKDKNTILHLEELLQILNERNDNNE